MKIDWSKVIVPKGVRSGEAKRGRVGSLSPKSAQRLIFGLANSPRPWGLMATLTFRERVMDGRDALRRFFRLLSIPSFSGIHCAWVREYQDRGAVHYHVLWDNTLIERFGGVTCDNMRLIKSRGKERRVVTGELERLIVDAWVKAVGDESDEFINFQRGGIVQLWEGENGAACYFGSYLAKAKQKTLPDDAEVNGRWWWICPEAKPVPIGTAFLTSYHLPFPLNTIFDREPLMNSLSLDLPHYKPKHLLQWLRASS